MSCHNPSEVTSVSPVTGHQCHLLIEEESLKKSPLKQEESLDRQEESLVREVREDAREEWWIEREAGDIRIEVLDELEHSTEWRIASNVLVDAIRRHGEVLVMPVVHRVVAQNPRLSEGVPVLLQEISQLDAVA